MELSRKNLRGVKITPLSPLRVIFSYSEAMAVRSGDILTGGGTNRGNTLLIQSKNRGHTLTYLKYNRLCSSHVVFGSTVYAFLSVQNLAHCK